MKPVNFNEVNTKFVAPGCGDLPACVTSDHIVSCWELDETDIKNIILTKRIYLGIKGRIQPPVFLIADNPVIREDK